MVGDGRSFPGSSAGKESTYNAGDLVSISGSGRYTGEGIGYPLQYSWASLVHHQLPELTQTHVSISNAIQPSHKSIKVSKSSGTEHSRAFCSVSSRDLGILEFKFKLSKDIPWESQVITHQKLPMGGKGGGHIQIGS